MPRAGRAARRPDRCSFLTSDRGRVGPRRGPRPPQEKGLPPYPPLKRIYIITFLETLTPSGVNARGSGTRECIARDAWCTWCVRAGHVGRDVTCALRALGRGGRSGGEGRGLLEVWSRAGPELR